MKSLLAVLPLMYSLTTMSGMASEVDRKTDSSCHEEIESFVRAVESDLNAERDVHPIARLAASEELSIRCPENLLLAISRFQLVEQIEFSADELVLEAYGRLVSAFEATGRYFPPDPILRSTNYLLSRNLGVRRCVAVLESLLESLERGITEEQWERIPEERGSRMQQSFMYSEIRTLEVLGRARLALGSLGDAADVANRMHSVALKIQPGPDLGRNHNEYFGAEYWMMRGRIAEQDGDLPNAYLFYQHAEYCQVHVWRESTSNAMRIWDLMGGEAGVVFEPSLENCTF